MAEVTKHGSRKMGKCNTCRCEFIADAKEIKIRNEPHHRIDDLGAWHENGAYQYHYIKCPECREEVVLWTDRT